MKIGLAHGCDQSTTGGFIEFAVFDADATSGIDSDRSELLWDLTNRARAEGLGIEKSALAFNENGRVMFYGTPDLVEYLANNGVPQWTHYLHVQDTD
jgi:hypothetical protein